MARNKKPGSNIVNVTEQCLCNFYFVFILGFLLGLCMSLVMLSSFGNTNVLNRYLPPNMRSNDRLNKIKNKEVRVEVDAKFVRKYSSTNLTIARHLEHKVQTIRGKELTRRMRILCWVMTAKHTHRTRAFTIKRTWGRHCDKLLFFSETEDPEVPTIKIDNVPPNRTGLWTKVVGAFKHVYKFHRDEYDWILRADDDTYAIIENIREMLLPYSPDQPGFFGYRFIPYSPRGYFSGGGGVIMSREAVERVVTQAFDDKNRKCPNTSTPITDDDVKIAECLYAVGIEPDDSRDFLGRSRMHCFDVESHLNTDQSKRDWWYWEYLWWPVKGGMACCGDNGIAWHYISPSRMYALEYLAYHVNVESVIFVAKAKAPRGGIPTTTTSTTYQPAGFPIQVP